MFIYLHQLRGVGLRAPAAAVDARERDLGRRGARLHAVLRDALDAPCAPVPARRLRRLAPLPAARGRALPPLHEGLAPLGVRFRTHGLDFLSTHVGEASTAVTGTRALRSRRVERPGGRRPRPPRVGPRRNSCASAGRTAAAVPATAVAATARAAAAAACRHEPDGVASAAPAFFPLPLGGAATAAAAADAPPGSVATARAAAVAAAPRARRRGRRRRRRHGGASCGGAGDGGGGDFPAPEAHCGAPGPRFDFVRAMTDVRTGRRCRSTLLT